MGRAYQQTTVEKIYSRVVDVGGLRLTLREMQFLDWSMTGDTMIRVAERYGLSVRTVHAHALRAQARNGCANSHQLMIRYVPVFLRRVLKCK